MNQSKNQEEQQNLECGRQLSLSTSVPFLHSLTPLMTVCLTAEKGQIAWVLYNCKIIIVFS